MALQDTANRRTTENATAVLYALLKALGVQVTRTTLTKELPLHPDFPSLLSLSETLEVWGVETAALQVDRVEQLGELPLPMLTHWHRSEDEYILVTGITRRTVTGWHNVEGTFCVDFDEFRQYWSGAVLLAEPTFQAGEAAYVPNRKAERLRAARIPFVLTGLGVVTLSLLGMVAHSLTTADWLGLLTKTVGLTVSILLVQKQIGLDNTLTDRFCRVHATASCEDVLNSPAATLWGWLSWSDVGFVYFAGGWLATLLVAVSPAVRSLVGWLALLALPYTVFSVYYQARVVRRWCPLCLVVQAVLLLEAGLAGVYLTAPPHGLEAYGTFLNAYLLPSIGWVSLKSLLLKAKQVPALQDELRIFWRNASLFETLLTQQPRMPSLPTHLAPIRLGDRQAEHLLTVVTNPYCRHCAQTHRELTQLLAVSSHLQAQLVFFACDGPTGPIHQVARHLLQAQAERPDWGALDNWYDEPRKVYAEWARQYPITGDESTYGHLVEQHCAWCRQAGLSVTPILYLDGYRLPHPYRLPHLRWLLGKITWPAAQNAP